jgi:plastocyanin
MAGGWLVMGAVLVAGALFLFSRPAGAGGGCHEPPSDERTTRVDMKGGCMLPSVARVDVNQPVTFTNYDEAPHTVSSVGLRSDTGGWGDFESIEQGDAVQHAFDDEGVYLYYCLFHPGMVGAIVVGEPSPTTGVVDNRPGVQAGGADALVRSDARVGGAQPASARADEARDRRADGGVEIWLLAAAAPVLASVSAGAFVLGRRAR